MKVTFEKNLNGIVFGFGLSFTGKLIIIGFIFWAITFEIKK